MMDYLRDPSAIYEKSFAIIRGETDLSGLPVSAEAIAIRMIHACGMTDGATALIITTRDKAKALGWRKDGRYLLLQDDIASVAFWYQAEPHAPFPALPDKDYLEVR